MRPLMSADACDGVGARSFFAEVRERLRRTDVAH